MLGGERDVKGCRQHNWEFGVQMRCWPRGESVWCVKWGVRGEKGCLGA